jgi:methionine-rich copper-binding protein CopC
MMLRKRNLNIISLKRVLYGVIIALCLPHHSFAHAIILESTPAPNATITGPDVQIILKFNSRIDGTRSRITLVQPDKSTHSVHLDKQDSPDKLKAQVTGLAAGAYILRWQVLAADGHITRGEIPFKIR